MADCWPKHVGEGITIQISHKIKVHMLAVNTILRLINAQYMEHISE
jgi:hypothetical protein